MSTVELCSDFYRILVVSGNSTLFELQCKHVHQEEFEDTKGVTRIRKSKKNREHNGQKKTDKRTNNDLQNIHIKLKIE